MNNSFARSHCIEATGFSRGIWIIWQDTFEIEVVLNHKQFVQCKLPRIINVPWFTIVYASPNPVLRKHLWVQLNIIAKTV